MPDLLLMLIETSDYPTEPADTFGSIEERLQTVPPDRTGHRLAEHGHETRHPVADRRPLRPSSRQDHVGR